MGGTNGVHIGVHTLTLRPRGDITQKKKKLHFDNHSGVSQPNNPQKQLALNHLTGKAFWS
jgi:hypothetical protein